ncbi:hypothetical protein [Bacillus sp. CECT 9360]|nr:hypothetical protein [Bacillus sp. CECT 9360]CAH0345726.1 hypothetical protein BCI9360_02024 [Bacillus sp. CECT 9360]
MKVTIIKGPNFKETEERAYDLLYKIISEKVKEEEKKKRPKI